VDGGISPKSVNRKIATLRAFYKYLLKKGVVAMTLPSR
jgi:site-specific recombinase XerD